MYVYVCVNVCECTYVCECARLLTHVPEPLAESNVYSGLHVT